MNRTDIQKTFIQKFHEGDIERESVDVILQIEKNLDTVLPQSYLDFMSNYNVVYTPSLLDLIVEEDADLHDLQNITSIKDTIEGTKMYWSGGMPDDLIGFGNDSMGNMFCFKKLPPDSKRPDDLPVWIFDHDFNKVSQISDSFDN